MKKLIITLVISIFSIFSVNAEEQLLTENEFKALKANMTNVCFKNTNGMYYYFAGFTGSTIYYSTIQSDIMRNTHNIEYSNIKVDYMYGTYTITNGSIMPEVQQVDDTSLDLVSDVDGKSFRIMPPSRNKSISFSVSDTASSDIFIDGNISL